MKRVVASAVVCVGLTLLVSGCAKPRTTGAKQPTSKQSASVSQVYGSQDWNTVGRQITAARKADPTLHATIPVQQSRPIDVIAPGVYDIETGPVPADTKPTDVRVSLPPDVTEHFLVQGSPLEGMTFVHRDSQTYAVIHMKVTQVASPYRGFTVWFQ